MPSISLRWASEKLCAPAGAVMPMARQAAAARVRCLSEIIWISLDYLGPLMACPGRGANSRVCQRPTSPNIRLIFRRFRPVGGDIVGPDPAGRTGWQAGLGPGGELARGLKVARRKRSLGGGEIGLGEVALLAIGLRQLA